MSYRRFCSSLILSFLSVADVRAQLATVPTQLGAPPVTRLAPGGTATVDLRTWLGVPGVTGQVV
ncbi:MAG: hypothetical protein H7343_02645, partial [Undibacterium sp.]|nr:hypothetical protein [Opitutaceae bacterium]